MQDVFHVVLTISSPDNVIAAPGEAAGSLDYVHGSVPVHGLCAADVPEEPARHGRAAPPFAPRELFITNNTALPASQLWIAVSVHLLVAIVNTLLNLSRSLYKIL